MKTCVVFACVCAVAYAQFASLGQNSQNFGFQQNFGNNQKANTRDNQNRYQQEQESSYTNPQNTYTSQQNKLSSQPTRTSSAGSCREKNERYPVSGSCDRYVECIDGVAEEKLCPDGLLFNPNVNFNVYPCQYPNEVQCLERSSLQPAQPTEDCPHQFGYFKLGDSRNCSGYRTCVNGVGYDLTCPEGLAFSSETYRCDWPDTVADCDTEAFLGFRCPEVPASREFGPPAGYRFYKSDVNCQKYFLCVEGRPRILSCGGDSAFDELTSSCVLADEVAACPSELKAAAARSREAEKQSLAEELAFKSKPQQYKRI